MTVTNESFCFQDCRQMERQKVNVNFLKQRKNSIMKKTLIAVAATAALALSATTFAAQQQANGAAPAAQNSWYGDINAGYGWTGDFFQNPFSGSIESGSGFAGNLNVGKTINQNIAVEGGFTYTGAKKTYKAQNASEEQDLDTFAFDIAVKGMMPISNNFGVFAKVGPALVHQNAKVTATAGNNSATAKADETNVQLFYAAGFDYAIQPNLTAQVQFMGFTGSDTGTTSINAITGGIGYRFA